MQFVSRSLRRRRRRRWRADAPASRQPDMLTMKYNAWVSHFHAYHDAWFCLVTPISWYRASLPLSAEAPLKSLGVGGGGGVN